MSKRKRIKVTIPATSQSIQYSLRTDFHCTEEEIDLINHALVGECTIEIAQYINDIVTGKIPLRIRPTLRIDMEDGTFQDVRLTNHPIALLHDYLTEKYEEPFSVLYWNAIVSRSPRVFYEMTQHLIKQSSLSEVGK